MQADLSCFKAYDIRGRVPEVLNGDLARALGQAVVEVLGASNVVLACDARLSGPELRTALCAGILSAGAKVTDIGLGGTEEIYFAAARKGFDLGIMITGSHNPADENGFKLVRGGAVPVSADSGLRQVRDRVADLLGAQKRAQAAPSCSAGEEQRVQQDSFRQDYVKWLLQYTGAEACGQNTARRRLKIVADAGNGCAGLVLGELARHLPFDFVFRQMEPDGAFPNGVPNPLLPERRAATADAVRAEKADLGIAWDGDFDRCFFFDGDGGFVEGYYCIGLLAQELLRRCPGGKVVHDPRVYWNTREVVLAAGGRPVMGKTGHAFMKERMRAEDAVYGGEMSAHHYFRDFSYCDSGMLPWLLVAIQLDRTGRPLAEILAERVAAFPCSGEINRRVADAPAVMRILRERYAPSALHEDDIDGVNLEFADWRFNVRMSNTEPLLRLNVESRGSRALVEDKTGELLRCIDGETGTTQG